jgi:PAS domain S-box-containing protein
MKRMPLRTGFEARLPQFADLVRDLVDSLTDAVLALDGKKRVTLINPAAQALFGVAEKAAIGRPLTWFFSSKDHVRMRQWFKPGTKNGSGTQSQRLFARDDRFGESPMHAKVKVLEHGTFEYSWAVLVRPAKAERNAKLEEVAAIVEHTDDAIYSRTIKGDVISWNAAAERMFGYSAQEIVGRSSRVLEPKTRTGEFDRLIARVRSGGTIRQFATERLRKDGRLIQVSLTVSPVRNSAGRLIGMSTIARDITQRVELESAMRQREQELTDFFNDAPLGLVWVGANGRIERINPAGARLLQCDEKQCQDQHLADFFIYPEQFERLLARLAAGAMVRGFQTTLRGLCGASLTVLVDANSVGQGRRMAHTYWFMRDITARKNLEREVLAVSERERQRLARELHDGLGQHLSGAAYLADSLREHLTQRRLPEVTAAERLTKLTEEAIQLTRDLAHGLFPVPAEPGGLMTALTDLAKRVRNLFHIHCRFLCREPVTIEDESMATHLYRIAQEAVHNAIRHGKATEIRISLRLRKRQVGLAILDNGVGIAATRPRGSGMGLSIMRYRAGLVHGSLQVEPRLEGGTEVVCSIDLRNTGQSRLTRFQELTDE